MDFLRFYGRKKRPDSTFTSGNSRIEIFIYEKYMYFTIIKESSTKINAKISDKIYLMIERNYFFENLKKI
jgi:hypothetical protein